MFMKKLLFIIVALVAWTTSYAQYFGATIFNRVIVPVSLLQREHHF